VQHRRAGRWETAERLGFHTGRQMSSYVPSDRVASASPRKRLHCGRGRVGDRYARLGGATRGAAIDHAAFDGAGLGGAAIDHVAFGDARVWLVDLCPSDESYAHALALLSDAERERARAIRSEQGARRFVLARGALRVRLGHALAIAPEHVTLRYGKHGKPELAPPPPGAEVGAARGSQGLPRFNLAHRDGVALLTIHPRHDIGIDVERIAPESERSWSKLLERICHPSEAREANAEARAIGSRAFYERWVGKEAVLKALGFGLSVSPAEVGLHRDGDGVLRVGELPGRQGAAAGPLRPAFGLSGATSRLSGAAVAAGGTVLRADSDLTGCRLATVRTPPGYVGALALLG
jgi:4'-phosphopantetheinyl transferase